LGSGLAISVRRSARRPPCSMAHRSASECSHDDGVGPRYTSENRAFRDFSSASQASIPPSVAWGVNRSYRRNSQRPSQDQISDPGSRKSKAPVSYVKRNMAGMQSILIHPFSILLVAFPLGILSACLDWGPNATFWLNFCALIPLAKILGDATEELDACLHNEVVSGLLNATFGNAVEVIMTVQTLRAGLTSLVKETLLGSVLSNMLLVLGMSFLFGGIVEMGDGVKAKVSLTENAAEPLLGRADSYFKLVTEKQQVFVSNSAMVSVTMLLVSCLSFTLPTIFIGQALTEREEVVQISLVSAGVVMLSYVAYLWFQLYTHKRMLQAADGDADSQGEEENEEEEDGLTFGFSLGLLAGTAVLVAVSSQLLVDVIEPVVDHAGISEAFIGIILLPIVGNACEHAAAVRFAVKNRPGLSVSIAVGSSVQIALFVVPLSVVMGWFLCPPGVDMTLNFGIMHVSVLIISVLVVLSIVVDGSATWLEGYMLCSAYVLIAVMYWHVKDSQLLGTEL